MTELWYEAEIKRPPLVTVDVPDAKFVERLHQTIDLCIRNKREEDVEFGQTAALLSRLIARRKSSFRRMIGFRKLLKLNATTCRLLRVDLPRDLEIFCGALPDMVCGEKSVAALPTRNCLDYVLIRLLSVHHIQQRIHNCTITAADHFLELLRANNFFDINTLLLAVIAKLRSLNVILGNNYIDLYHKLLKHRDRFPIPKQKSLISKSTDLPEVLEYFQLPAMEAEEKIDTSVNVIKSSSSSAVIVSTTPKVKKRIDIGIELKRSKKLNESNKLFKVEQLKTVEDVKNFIAAENEARKKLSQKSIAHRIPSHLWVGAQKIFERKLQSGETKKALSVFLKFLSTNL